MNDFTVANIKFLFVEIGRFTNCLQKVMPERISISEWVFVIRNNSGVQIFNSVLDKKARQKTFTKNVHPGSSW